MEIVLSAYRNEETLIRGIIPKLIKNFRGLAFDPFPTSPSNCLVEAPLHINVWAAAVRKMGIHLSSAPSQGLPCLTERGRLPALLVSSSSEMKRLISWEHNSLPLSSPTHRTGALPKAWKLIVLEPSHSHPRSILRPSFHAGRFKLRSPEVTALPRVQCSVSESLLGER